MVVTLHPMKIIEVKDDSFVSGSVQSIDGVPTCHVLTVWVLSLSPPEIGDVMLLVQYDNREHGQDSSCL